MLVDTLKNTIRIHGEEATGNDPNAYNPWMIAKIALGDKKCIVIDASSVRDFIVSSTKKYWGESEESLSLLDIEDKLYCCLPPSEIVWIEYQFNNTVGPYLHKFIRLQTNEIIMRVGCLLLTQTIDESLHDSFQETYGSLSISEASHSIMVLFFLGNKNGCVPLYFNGRLLLDDRGIPMKAIREERKLFRLDDPYPGVHKIFQFQIDPDYRSELESKLGENDAGQVINQFGFMVEDMLIIPIMTLSLLNVKNIVLREHKYDEKIQRKRQKSGKLPLVKVHTLEIEAPGIRKIGEKPETSGESSKKALHLVRGHLADYRDGKGLFGKYKGVFWMPPHMRGSVDNGIVKKRYSIKNRDDA